MQARVEAATGAPAFYARGHRDASGMGPRSGYRSTPKEQTTRGQVANVVRDLTPSIRPDRRRGPDANYSSRTLRNVTFPTGTGLPSRTNIGAWLIEVATNGVTAIFGAW